MRGFDDLLWYVISVAPHARDRSASYSVALTDFIPRGAKRPSPLYLQDRVPRVECG